MIILIFITMLFPAINAVTVYIMCNHFLMCLQYRQAVGHQLVTPPMHLQNKQRSFLAFGFGAGNGAPGVPSSPANSSMQQQQAPGRRDSHININVAPTSHDMSDTPEIRKYKKRFSSEILCASLWGKKIRAT